MKSLAELGTSAENNKSNLRLVGVTATSPLQEHAGSDPGPIFLAGTGAVRVKNKCAGTWIDHDIDIFAKEVEPGR